MVILAQGIGPSKSVSCLRTNWQIQGISTGMRPSAIFLLIWGTEETCFVFLHHRAHEAPNYRSVFLSPPEIRAIRKRNKRAWAEVLQTSLTISWFLVVCCTSDTREFCCGIFQHWEFVQSSFQRITARHSSFWQTVRAGYTIIGSQFQPQTCALQNGISPFPYFHIS